MIPQGSVPLNTTYFTQLTAQINAVNSCAELQSIVTAAIASLQAEKNAIAQQLAAIQPILALLQPPGANLGAIVTWITTYINSVLTPLVKPNLTYETQLAELAAQVAAVTSAIESAAARIGSCSITVSPLT